MPPNSFWCLISSRTMTSLGFKGPHGEELRLQCNEWHLLPSMWRESLERSKNGSARCGDYSQYSIEIYAPAAVPTSTR